MENKAHRLFVCHSTRSVNTGQTTRVAPRHNVCGCRYTTNFIIRFPTLSLLFFLSLFLDEIGKSTRAREWTPWEKFVSIWCCARFTTCESSIVKSRRLVTNHPFTVRGKSLHVQWFYDERFRSGHYEIHACHEKPGHYFRRSSRSYMDLWILNRSKIKLEIVRMLIPQNIET